MLDRIESMEAAAERWFDEATKGLPSGQFRCDCGRIDELDHACSATENPYSAAICRKCQEELGF